MKQQAVNPYLPGYEYVPDGEPHIFNGRVYVYGSHDKYNGPIFCMNDYVCWSAPVNDLSDWRYEGVIYRKKQDPHNTFGLHGLYAPDVCKGPDGRYYLYYALDFYGIMSVAVCDSPAGQYEYYGDLKFPDGHVWGTRSGEPFPFDPGVLVDDDGRIYLYSGFATKIPPLATRMKNLTNEGCVVLELEADMVTIRSGPKLILPTDRYGGRPGFENHEFFEASSPRKIDGKYCLVYSTRHNHELAYAVSESPMGDFSFEGTLISIGDVFLDGIKEEKQARNYLGNTHGGLLELNGKWYIFYHRQTNRHSYSRQACAEVLKRTANGHFCQAEITSCGLNGKPLVGKGEYESRIACNLWSRSGVARYDEKLPRLRLRNHPYFRQTGPDGDETAVQYIANMRDGAVAGFKYFAIYGLAFLSVKTGGKGSGKIRVSTSPEFTNIVAEIPVSAQGDRLISNSARAEVADGVWPLYFRYEGTGAIDFYSFLLGGDA